MKNTAKKVAVFDPYLDVLGGGEKYILSIAQVFNQCGFEVDLLWHNPQIINDIKNRLNLSFSRLRIIDNFLFRQKQTCLLNKNFIQKLLMTKSFDYLFYVTDGSYFFSLAKNNFVYAMVPDKNLYKNTLINRTRLFNFRFLTHSKFVKSLVDQWVNQNSQVIYPFIDKDLLIDKSHTLKKDKIILTVGRFFGHLHSKRQDIVIQSFKRLRQKYELFRDFKLYLAGGFKKEDEDYFEKLKRVAKNDANIFLLPNVDHQTILKLYQKAMFYWHAAGYGVDEDKHPELVEHLGIAPLEAMAAGCVTFCVNSGGPKELIKDGENGFLYDEIDQLINKTVALYQKKEKRKKIVENAKKKIKDNFSYEVFKRKVVEYFELEIPRPPPLAGSSE